MNVVIASDGSGFQLKEVVKKHLAEAGFSVTDVGQREGGRPMTHIDAARDLAKAVKGGVAERAIIFCGTGGGASMCVNKIRGMYCVACESLFSAPKIAMINNANVLAMGARIVGPENACEMAEAFLRQDFAGGFAQQRKETVEGLYRDMVALEDEAFAGAVRG